MFKLPPCCQDLSQLLRTYSTVITEGVSGPLIISSRKTNKKSASVTEDVYVDQNQTSLFKRLKELIPQKREEYKQMKVEHGNKQLGTYTVEQAYSGMRDIKGLIYETSLLDPIEGIRFRGLSVQEARDKLPKASSIHNPNDQHSYNNLENPTDPAGEEPLPEGILWLLFTGEMPTHGQVRELSKELKTKADELSLPKHVIKMIKEAAQAGIHPMTQFSMGILGLQRNSKFAKEYAAGVDKRLLWVSAYEDAINLIASLPTLASTIYLQTFHIKGRKKTGSLQSVLDMANELCDWRFSTPDWAGRFADQLCFASGSKIASMESGETKKAEFRELLRLYLTIHADHEGGNVSAHTTKLVGSALSDPYLSFSAGMNGLAGPLHGLANQEVLRWMFRLIEVVGMEPTDEQLRSYLWTELNAGKVIPGYGHAVLRRTDPRYIAQRDFALKRMPTDPLFRLCSQLYNVVPNILHEQGKTKNPYPNVDAHSGVLLQHYGLKEQDFYTVLFGVSRALGVMASYFWDRALLTPLERPKSLTTEAIKTMINANEIQ